jgi:mannose/fructose/N-acetylgalactosamine-specific phosphotransferase system component IIC
MGSALRTVRVIQIAMLVSIGIYAVVGETVGTRVTTDLRVLYAIPFASISLVGAILVVRKTMVLQSEDELKAKPGDPAVLARWKTGYVVTYVLCEALALFGLLLRVMGSTLSQVWPYYAGGFVLLLLFWPRVPQGPSSR